MKHGGGSITIWSFSANGTGALHILKGKIDGSLYRDVGGEFNVIGQESELDKKDRFLKKKEGEGASVAVPIS